jgi:hypothetical protein
MLSDLWRHDARLERSIFRSLKELQRLKAQRPKRPDTTGPMEQESPNQTQTIPPPSIEPITYETEPTPKSQRKHEPDPSFPPIIECLHKRLLSPKHIAFGGGLS